MCTPVKQYVQKQRMAMQKQQQESLRQREAERQRYGESRLQVSVEAGLHVPETLAMELQPYKHIPCLQIPGVTDVGAISASGRLLLPCEVMSKPVSSVRG